MRKLNFSSGPAMLPEEVLRRAQGALLDLDGSGIGILEHSHRGPEFSRVLERTEAAIRDVGGIGMGYRACAAIAPSVGCARASTTRSRRMACGSSSSCSTSTIVSVPA